MSTADMHGKPGHNNGAPHWADERHAHFATAIETYITEERAGEAMLSEEFTKLDGGARLVFLKTATVLDVVRYARRNKGADCTLGVYQFIVAMSDNDKGYCWLSQRRIAEIFGRSQPRISAILNRLSENGLFEIGASIGETAAIGRSPLPC